MVVELVEQISRGEAGRTGGRQLDGQRDAVQSAADLLHAVAAGQRIEGGRRRGCRRRTGRRPVRSVPAARRGSAAQDHAAAPALPATWRAPARRGTLRRWPGRTRRRRRRRARSCPARAAPGASAGPPRPTLPASAPDSPCAQRGGDRPRHVARRDDLREVDHPGAVVDRKPPRRRQRQPGLADPPAPTKVTRQAAKASSTTSGPGRVRQAAQPGKIPRRLSAIGSGGCSPLPSW